MLSIEASKSILVTEPNDSVLPVEVIGAAAPFQNPPAGTVPPTTHAVVVEHEIEAKLAIAVTASGDIHVMTPPTFCPSSTAQVDDEVLPRM